MSPTIGEKKVQGLSQASAMRSDPLISTNGILPPISRRNPAIDPALSMEEAPVPARMQDQGYKDAINAWSRFRFVRAGWFTPAEAIDYIE
jgi:hypothetical protein